MTAYIAFPASETLHRNTVALTELVASQPNVIQRELINEISEEFISEVLDAFFDRPVNTLNVQGSMASVLNGVMSVIAKAARMLVNKVFNKVTPAEQQALSAQFTVFQLSHQGKPWLGFPVDAASANQIALMFESFRQGSGEEEHLVEVMGLYVDGAINQFFDKTLGLVKTGPITRGLVNAGRATIHKAAYSAMQKTLPGLHPKVRQPVLNYFESMLIEVQ